MAGVVALIAGNTRVVVDPGFFRDFFFALGPWIPFVSGARLQSDRIGGGLFDWMMMSLFGDPQQIRNAARATHLFSKRTKTWAEFSLVTFFEGLFFATLAGEILFVPIGVLLGRIPVDDVHWFQLTVDAAVFVTLSRMWIDIKKIHEKVAAALLAESKPDATFIYSMPTEGGP
jgi:hypothetical protein